jgi:hypothetical protein
MSAMCVQASPSSGGLAFIKNQGQWDSRAQYLASMGGGDVWLTKEGYVLDVHQQTDTAIKGQVVRMSFSGGNSSYADGVQVLGKMNYFIGNVASKWTTNVPRFAGATAQHMLPGLDVRYYFDQGSPRYDLILAPGADPSSIAMNFEGANSLNVLPSGNLQIETSLGPIEERGLVAYQQQGSVRVSVPCQMVVTGSTVHFRLADYDKSKPLIIDPLLFCTYWSGGDQTSPIGTESICADASGNIITVGHASSGNLPTTTGAYQTSNISYFGAGYISTLSANGQQLLYGTFLSGTAINAGGTDGDTIVAVTTDAQGALYVTGQARSSDFPVTSGAVQPTKKNPTTGSSNAFIAEISPDGGHLIFSTFLGGTGSDVGSGIGRDSLGNVIVSGSAGSNDFPVTPGSYRTSSSPNDPKAFVTKLNTNGTGILFSTLIPGGAVAAPDLKVDSQDNIILGGYANRTYFSATAGPYNTPLGFGYVLKLAKDGSKVVFSTLIAAGVTSIDVTPTDGVAFATSGTEYRIYWPDAYDMAGTYHWTNYTGYFYCVGQFSGDGKTLLHSTIESFAPNMIHVDKAGNLYLCGSPFLADNDLPTTSDAIQHTKGTLYFAELSPEQDKLLYATYFANDEGTNADTFVIDTINRFAILCETTYAAPVPITPGAYNSTYGPQFLSLISVPIYTHVELTPSSVVGGQSVAGKVTLPAAAPAGGSVITLSSTDPGVKLPATVTIPAKSISQTFTITTTGVVAPTSATISAKFGVGSGTAQLVRTPAVLTSFTAATSPVIAGQTTSATILLNGQAGPGGDLIQLSSSNANVTVPSSIAISYGSNQAVFQVKTAVAAASYSSQVTAKFGSVTKTLSVEVDPGLTSLTVSPTSVVAGATAQGVVKLSGKVGALGATVSLSSSTTAATVPSSVTVPAGAALVAFNITTAGVNVATTATITAKEGSLTQTATLTIQPATLSFFTLTPTSVKGGTGVQGVVRLNGPAGPSGVSVTLSSPSTLATVPAKVLIAPGASYFVFAIGTKPVTTSTPVSLKAVSGTTLTAVLTINP